MSISDIIPSRQRSGRFGFREAPRPQTEKIIWRCCACGNITTVELVRDGEILQSRSRRCPCDIDADTDQRRRAGGR